jgi:chromosome segregation ATPase
MLLKDFWTGTGTWLRTRKLVRFADDQPRIDNEGLISQGPDSMGYGISRCQDSESEEEKKVVVKTVQPVEKRASLERLQDGFDKLVEQLRGVNEHLDRQITQHKELMAGLEQLPQLLQRLPNTMENQRRLSEQLFEQLKANAGQNQQLISAVQKIPAETVRQTDTLVDINNRLAASADIDVQMVENFNKFNQTLKKLDQTTAGQTDSIMQMNKTFAISDRYLKYILAKQSKRFMWVFIVAVSVCMAAIITLAGIVVYLGR